MIKCFTEPYEGEKAYAFFSYCHEDASLVYPIIERLIIEGFRVWFDDGIHPGEEWPEVIARHLSNARVCIAAVSPASTESHNCRNEVSFAVANNKPLLSIVLQDFQMPLGMQLQLSSANYIRLFERSPEGFYERLFAAPNLLECRDNSIFATEEMLSQWRSHVKLYQKKIDTSPTNPVSSFSGWFGDNPVGPDDPPPDPVGPDDPPPDPVGPDDPPPDPEEPDDPLPDPVEPDDPSSVKGTVYIPKEKPLGTILEEQLIPAILIRIKTGKMFSVKRNKTIIGRSEKADLILKGNEAISRKHAEVIAKNGKLYLHELDATNTTEVNGKKVEKNQTVLLPCCTELLLANESFFLVYGKPYETIFDEQKICMLRSKDTGEIRLLADETILLDRKHKWRDNVLGDQRIRRENQAEIYRIQDTLFLRDTGSKNGTYHNGRRLKNGESVELHDGDAISIVETEFSYHENRLGI